MNKNLYMDINVLQTVPSSNINRDDTGSPKTAIYGGVTRSRVSSQSWKRAMRLAFKQDSENEEWLKSYRTLKTASLLANKLQELDSNLSEEDALKKVEEVFKVAGIKLKKDKKTGEMLTGALLLVSEGQLEKIAKLALSVDQIDKDTAKEIKRNLMEDQSLDLALFGRMVADNPELNVDASSQVAHAISTHEVTPEFDYYTAVDDANAKSQTGSAMLGTIEYNSSTLYRYANVNILDLLHNLGNKDLTIEGIKLFIKEFVLTMPTGKENTFANKTLPQYVMVNVRTDTPVNLVSAFETPVRSEGGYVDKSIDRLKDEYKNSLKFVDKPVFNVELTNSENIVDNQAENIDDLINQTAEFVKQELENEDSND